MISEHEPSNVGLGKAVAVVTLALDGDNQGAVDLLTEYSQPLFDRTATPEQQTEAIRDQYTLTASLLGLATELIKAAQVGGAAATYATLRKIGAEVQSDTPPPTTRHADDS